MSTSIKRITTTRSTSNVEIVFNPSVELPSEWDTSPHSVNLNEELLVKLKGDACNKESLTNDLWLMGYVTVLDMVCGLLIH